jgi:hypothetical protein
MKSIFGFVILALSVLMYVPSVTAQTSQVQTPAQTSAQDPLATPDAVPDLVVIPPGNHWLLSSWYCVPADCFDYAFGLNTSAYTAAYGTCYGALSGAVNPAPVESIVAENCAAVAYLETGTATFRLTYITAFHKTYGLEGLIVPAQATTQDGVIVGFALQWCNGTTQVEDFVIEC